MRQSTIIKKIRLVLKQYGAKKAALFGSAARGDMTKSSDIDILVDIKKDVSLLGLIKLKLTLEGLLNRNVDLVEYNALKPAIKDAVLKERVPIL